MTETGRSDGADETASTGADETESDGAGETGDEAAETVRCWLVERSFDQRNLVTLVYATPDGERYQQRELSANALSQIDVTAAREVRGDELEPVTDDERRERYAEEAATVAADHDPDDEL